MPAGEFIPVGRVREWLGQHRPGENDVAGGDVAANRPFTAPAGEYLLEELTNLGAKCRYPLIGDDRAAVQREDQVVAGRNRLLEEMRERRGR